MKRVARGFTLIELMTVIAIIGILATIVTISLISSRVRGRDAQRVATLQILRAAIDQYAVDKGHYPTTNQWTSFDPSNIYYGNSVTNPVATNIVAALQPYLNQPSYIDPLGPAGSGNDNGYLYYSNGTDYLLMSWRKPENMNNFNPEVVVLWRCGSIINDKCSNAGSESVGFWTPGAKTGNW